MGNETQTAHDGLVAVCVAGAFRPECDRTTGELLPRAEDAGKAAAVFYERYAAARRHPKYVRLKTRHRERYEGK